MIEELPPRPFTQLIVCAGVSLYRADCVGTIEEFLHLAMSDMLASDGLEPREDVVEVPVPSFFELGQDSGLEEDLCEDILHSNGRLCKSDT